LSVDFVGTHDEVRAFLKNRRWTSLSAAGQNQPRRAGSKPATLRG